MTKLSILYLPIWKLVEQSSHLEAKNIFLFSASPRSVLPTVKYILPPHLLLPLWMPSRQRYFACLSSHGISSLWRQLRHCSLFLLVSYRLLFSSGFTSRVGIKKLFSFKLFLSITINSCSGPLFTESFLEKLGLALPPSTHQGNLKSVHGLPKLTTQQSPDAQWRWWGSRRSRERRSLGQG